MLGHIQRYYRQRRQSPLGSCLLFAIIMPALLIRNMMTAKKICWIMPTSAEDMIQVGRGNRH